MKELQGRFWGYVNVTFPERQIYIRSDGRVQFFTFSPLMQAVCAGAGVLFLGWVAFTSVNVIFKDRIIVAKERHFEQMQASYENRIAELQLSYDELHGALVAAEDRFKLVADSLDAKQRTLAQIIEKKESLRASLQNGLTPGLPATVKNASNTTTPLGPVLAQKGGVGGIDILPSQSAAAFAPSYAPGSALSRENKASVAPHETVSTPAAPQLERQTFLRGAMQRFGALFSRAAVVKNIDNPSLRQIEQDRTRVLRLDTAEPNLLAEANKDLADENARLTRALRTTGINTKSLMGRLSQNRSVGGPLIPLGDPALGMEDTAFGNGVIEAASTLEKLSDTVTVLNAIPLAMPTTEGSMSSNFGARVDPFNESLAFHSGIDFSAPIGTDVFSTAPGMVVFAGKNGAYGNSIEVDHGYGMRTRYGHLSKILVQVGSQVGKGDLIGKLGNTGRSTGPHVHYEIWYDDAVRDPSRFIKAGRYVLEN
jgi:murein DD-endopeptidase MepM/ murein hydrolase activator NlpD